MPPFQVFENPKDCIVRIAGGRLAAVQLLRFDGPLAAQPVCGCTPPFSGAALEQDSIHPQVGFPANFPGNML